MASAGVRECCRCHEVKSLAQFHGQGRTCAPCRAAADAPKPTETEWQRTVEQALTMFGWSWQHVRRTRGRHGEWTTSTSHAGWPDLVALRGPIILGVELKTDVGKATDDQLEWLGRFARLVGGRAWLIRPSDPSWDTFVAWIKDPTAAPRRHGW